MDESADLSSRVGDLHLELLQAAHIVLSRFTHPDFDRGFRSANLDIDGLLVVNTDFVGRVVICLNVRLFGGLRTTIFVTRFSQSRARLSRPLDECTLGYVPL